MFGKIDFIQGETRKCLLAMVLPMIAAMFLNLAYTLVDSLWIGNLLGKIAYAALTNATPVILIVSSIGLGSTNGVAILLSQAVGAGDKEKTERLTATSFVIALIFSAAVTVLTELLLRPLLLLLRTPEETYTLAYRYLAVYLLGYVPVYLYCYFTAVLRSFGNSVFQMVAILICTVLNAILDPILIHFFGFSGAAAATLLSQLLCLVFMLLYLRKKHFVTIRLKAFDRSQIKSFFAKGVPSAFQQSIPGISTAFLTALVSTCGLSAIAAYGITGKLEMILFYPAMALNMVLTSIIGQCVGGGRPDRARDYLKISILYGAGFLAVLTVLVVVFARPLSGWFLSGADVADIVVHYFGIVAVGYVLNTVTNCFLGGLNGLGKPGRSMACMILYYLLVRMPLAWSLYHAGAGLDGIWWAVLISHVVAAATALLLWHREFGALCRSAGIICPKPAQA